MHKWIVRGFVPFCLVSALQAQPSGPAPLENVVSLGASASTEVAQDWLTMTLFVTKDGADPMAVQAQLQQALEAALAETRKHAQAAAMEVHSGAINLQPRYNRDGKINGWTGTAELVLEGADFGRIALAAAKVRTMAIAQAAFSLSRQARQKAEADIQAAAIERFKTRAADVARAFGFSAYTLREVALSNDSQVGYQGQPRMATMVAKAELGDAPPMPLESGKTTVAVTLQGTVVLK